MSKRDYPLFIIDRSKKNPQMVDYIVCMDKICGFVARIVPFYNDRPINEFINQPNKVDDSDYTSIIFKLDKGGIILLIDDFMFLSKEEVTAENKARVKVLMKKALKKYLHADKDQTSHDDLYIENQIEHQQLIIKHCNALSGGEEKHNIEIKKAILNTLICFRDNQKYFYLNLN